MAEERKWPVLAGHYVVGDRNSAVAIATLVSSFEESPGFPKEKFAIAGEVKTENLGVERVVINTITNPHIRHLIVCGTDSTGHNAGQSIVAIHKNGIGADKKIVGSKGAIPFIENLSPEAIERFQKQVEVHDLVGETDLNKVLHLAERLLQRPNDIFEGGAWIYRIEKQEKKLKVLGDKIAIAAGVYLDPVSWLVEAS